MDQQPGPRQTSTNRRRPGLDQALAAVRAGDTLVVPKLDRLARSVPDARDIGDSLVARGVRLSLGGTIYDPADPMGKMFFNILATFAEFESTCCGYAPAKEWRSLAPRASCAASSPSSPPGSSASWYGCKTPASTPSPSWANCSPSPGHRLPRPRTPPHHQRGSRSADRALITPPRSTESLFCAGNYSDPLSGSAADALCLVEHSMSYSNLSELHERISTLATAVGWPQ